MFWAGSGCCWRRHSWSLHLAGGPPFAETRETPDADPSEIVIDEVVGMWIALWPVSLGAMMQGVDVTALWPGWVTAFLAFRAFDIWKPGPVGLADRMHTPLGVMLDDVVAGLLATFVVAWQRCQLRNVMDAMSRRGSRCCARARRDAWRCRFCTGGLIITRPDACGVTNVWTVV